MRTTGSVLRQTTLDDLSERIGVVYFETTRNERGDVVKGAENVRCMVWAKVLPLTGRIEESTPERINSVTHRVTIRYRTDILPDDEILWRGRRFKMVTVPVDVEGRHIWTMFEVKEAVSDGAYKQAKT